MPVLLGNGFICQACCHHDYFHRDGRLGKNSGGCSRCSCVCFGRVSVHVYIDREIERILSESGDAVEFVILALLQTRDVALYGTYRSVYDRFVEFKGALGIGRDVSLMAGLERHGFRFVEVEFLRLMRQFVEEHKICPSSDEEYSFIVDGVE